MNVTHCDACDEVIDQPTATLSEIQSALYSPSRGSISSVTLQVQVQVRTKGGGTSSSTQPDLCAECQSKIVRNAFPSKLPQEGPR